MWNQINQPCVNQRHLLAIYSNRSLKFKSESTRIFQLIFEITFRVNENYFKVVHCRKVENFIHHNILMTWSIPWGSEVPTRTDKHPGNVSLLLFYSFLIPRVALPGWSSPAYFYKAMMCKSSNSKVQVKSKSARLCIKSSQVQVRSLKKVTKSSQVQVHFIKKTDQVHVDKNSSQVQVHHILECSSQVQVRTLTCTSLLQGQ